MPAKLDSDSIAIVKKSFGRVCRDQDFFDAFYTDFIEGNPEVKAHFKNTDLNKQKVLLKDSITMSLLYASGSEYATKFLENVAYIHNRQHRNIEPYLYSYWKRSFLNNLRKFDPKWDLSVEKEWNQLINLILEFLKSKY